MSDESRSSGVSPWDPGQACRGGIGACLPPRKRLLAGLKQSGLLSASSSYLQSCNGASCAGLMGDLKLEVDLAQANVESHGDTCIIESAVCEEGECNAVESSFSLKSKKAVRRRKSLSVLADCHGSVNKLQSEALPGSKVENKIRTSKAWMKTALTSTGENESGSSVEMVDAARAAAAKAAKAAVEARAIAFDKAQAAAKAAAVAKAALEALAYAAYDDDNRGFQSSKHGREHKRKGYKLNKELSRLFHTGIVNSFSENREQEQKVHGCTAPLDDGMEVAKTHVSRVVLSPVRAGAGRDKIKEDSRAESHQFLIVDLASAPSDKSKEDEQALADDVHIAAPLDDEKLARQLHRVMNSSPRIFRKRGPLESSKKLGMAPKPTQGCIQNRYPRAGGCNLSRGRKPAYKEKQRVLGASTGRADVKVKSMSVINETLNMLQGVSSAQFCVLDGMVSCAASHASNSCAKEDLSMPITSIGAFASLSESTEEGEKLIVNGGSASRCVLDGEARSRKASSSGYPHEPGAVGADTELRIVKCSEMKKKQKLCSEFQTEGSLFAASSGRFHFSSQRRVNSCVGEMPAVSAKSHPATSCDSGSDASGSDSETSRDYDPMAIDENKGTVNVSELGSMSQVAGDNAEGMSTVSGTQDFFFCDKASRATGKSLPVSSQGERHTRRQKVLVALANGLSKANQNFGGSLNLSSYIPSPTVS